MFTGLGCHCHYNQISLHHSYLRCNFNTVDDWKADQYRWRNFSVKLYPAKSSLVNKTVFHVQTKKAVRAEFRRICYQYLTEPSKVVIQYIGDNTVAEAFPHGNSNDTGKMYIRSCPSLLASLKVGVRMSHDMLMVLEISACSGCTYYFCTCIICITCK